MKAISLWRPWPWLIVHGHKRMENRPWQTPWRGWLLLHAAHRWDPAAVDLARQHRIDIPPLDSDHPTGIAAAVHLTGICGQAVALSGWTGLLDEPVCECGRWAFPGQYHWQLRDIRPVDPPIPHRGHQGIRDAPRDIELAVFPYLRGTA